VHLQRDRLGDPSGRKETDAFALHPAQDELERARRGRVEPLDVVDSEEHRSLCGEIPEEGADGCGDGALVRHDVAGVRT
jgi:hypothetical protein